MSNWKNVKGNSNLIQVTTETSVLIKLPNSKFKFWHPKKCVKTSGKNNYLMSIGYTDEFVFKIFRNGEGSHSKFKVIEEKTISVEDFEAFWN